MKLVNIHANNLYYEGYILIETINDLDSYYEKFRNTQIDNMNKQIVRECSGITAGIRLLANNVVSLYETQLNIILTGKKLAINLKGGYFALSNDAIIEEVNVNNNTIFKSKFLN